MTDKLSTHNSPENFPISQDSDTKPAPSGVNTTPTTALPQAIKPKKENMLLNIVMNIVVPTVILTKFSGDNYLGAKLGLIIALAFPIIYGVRDFVSRRNFNFFSAIGVVSVLLTGGISLMHLDTEYYAIKEAAIPGLIGLIVIISAQTRAPLVKKIIYNDSILNIDKISKALAAKGTEKTFEKTLRNSSYFVASSFFMSAVLNYVLAKMIVVSATGTVEFNEQIGKMHYLGFLVIGVPSFIMLGATLFYIFRSIRLQTGLTMEDIMLDDSDNQ